MLLAWTEALAALLDDRRAATFGPVSGNLEMPRQRQCNAPGAEPEALDTTALDTPRQVGHIT